MVKKKKNFPRLIISLFFSHCVFSNLIIVIYCGKFQLQVLFQTEDVDDFLNDEEEFTGHYTDPASTAHSKKSHTKQEPKITIANVSY